MHEKCANILLLGIYIFFPHLFALARLILREYSHESTARSRTTLQTTLLHYHCRSPVSSFHNISVFIHSGTSTHSITRVITPIRGRFLVVEVIYLYVVKWCKERRSVVEVLDGWLEWMMMMARAQRGRLGTYLSSTSWHCCLLLYCVFFLYSQLYTYLNVYLASNCESNWRKHCART